MALRFRCSDDSGAEFSWDTVTEVLDALEAGVLDPRAHLFDAARQCWQVAGAHPEVRAAWEERRRFRPADAACDLPPIEELTPAPPEADPGALDDLARRRLALAYMRQGRTAAAAAVLLGEVPPPVPIGPPRPAVPPLSAGLLAGAAVILAIVAWGVVQVARGVADVATMRDAAPAHLTASVPAEAAKR
jgi:hypothetical protein